MTEENQTEGIKAGARHSASDIADMQSLHDIAVRQGAKCPELVHLAAEPMMKADDIAVKATSLDMAYTVYNTPPLAIKIAGEMELDVCYMPYTGQKNGKDADGQYFSPRTNEYAERFPTPLVLYYHGYERQGVQQPIPEEIGTSMGRKWIDKAGRWIRVKLDATKEKANRVWQSAQKGNARASSDSISHLVRVNPDGEIINWAFVGISLFETETGKKPSNAFAFALPAAKALGLIVDDEPDNDLQIVTAAIIAAIQNK